MRLFAFVCLSVSKITQKRVHGFGWNVACRQMSGHGRTDYLLSQIRIIVRMPKPDCFFRYRISAGTRNYTSGKSDVYVLAAAATRCFTMVLFTEAVSSRNTFVGGTCAPSSTLLDCSSRDVNKCCVAALQTYYLATNQQPRHQQHHHQQ